MKHVLDYDELDNIKENIEEINILLEYIDYDEICIFLKEECDFEDSEIEIFFTLNEGLWDKLKSGASKLKDKASNAKAKLTDIKDKVSDKYQKVKNVGSKVKDHIARNKGKYILGGAALASGVGVLGAGLALGAGHLADRHSN